MKNFDDYLDKTGEAGFVSAVFHSIAYADGLPGAKIGEMILFEGGGVGQVFSLLPDKVEILILSSAEIIVGSKVARTGKEITIFPSEDMLGKIISPLDLTEKQNARPVNTPPMGMLDRKLVSEFFETGVSLVDLLIPLGRGQRELLIGDRKTGKTEFMEQVLKANAKNGGINIYCAIGQRQSDILKRYEFLKKNGILGSSIIVATNSDSPPGLIFLSPYSAVTIAEYFRDKGLKVLLVLDDMTSHARYYRELSLLARRFPGKSSYPGDTFYVQAKIIERTGNFEKGSITCLPVAESVSGDLSGYIQTNLMSMTDGHLYFDRDIYNEGKRPAVNALLSVTRVGHQTQSSLMRDTSRVLSSFLVSYEKMKQYKHFGAEAGEIIKEVWERGKMLDQFFNQPEGKIIPINVNLLVVAGIWSNVTDNIDDEAIYDLYENDINYKKRVDSAIASSSDFESLVRKVREDPTLVSVPKQP